MANLKIESLFGNLLSPFNGIAITGIVSVWATTEVMSDFKYYLLGFSVFSIFAAAVGDYLHHIIKNRAESENIKIQLEREKTQLETAKTQLEIEKLRKD